MSAWAGAGRSVWRRPSGPKTRCWKLSCSGMPVSWFRYRARYALTYKDPHAPRESVPLAIGRQPPR